MGRPGLLIFTILLCCLSLILYYQFRYSDIGISDTSVIYQEANALEINHLDATLSTEELQSKLNRSSLRGTQANDISVGFEDGRLLLNGHIQFYFDYFLSLRGEMPIDNIKLLVKNDLATRFSQEIAVAMFELFLRYIRYTNSLEERLVAGGYELEDVPSIKSSMRSLYFHDYERQALFGGYDKLLAQPAKARKMYKDLVSFNKVRAESPEAVEAVATELFGEHAAQRLANNEIRKQVWEQRLRQYQCEKEAILSNVSLDQYGKNEGLALLLERSFSASETRRIKSLERSSLIKTC